MATLTQIQVPSSGLAVNVSTLAKNKTLVYAGSQGNEDVIYVQMSEDGVNYNQLLIVNGPGVYNIPATIDYLRAAWTPTPSGPTPAFPLGIIPALYCNGTMQDNVTSVTSVSVAIPLALTGGKGPATTLSLLDGTVVWAVKESFAGIQPWIANGVYLPGTLLKVPNTTPAGLAAGTINYWITRLGVTAGVGPVSATLQGTQTFGQVVADTGTGNWQSVLPWTVATAYTSGVDHFVFANGVVFSCITSGTSAVSGLGPSGLNYDGLTAWNFIEALGTPANWSASATYLANTIIAVPATGGGINYWITATGGTSAAGGTPGTLTGVQTLGTLYVDNTVTWYPVVSWTQNQAYSTTAPTTLSNYVRSNGNVYLCALTGVSVINPNGPGAYIDLTALIGGGDDLPDNFTALYANGGSQDSLTLQGSPDGMNWANLEWDDNQNAVFSGVGQNRYIDNAAIRYIGALFNVQVSGSLSIIASENITSGYSGVATVVTPGTAFALTLPNSPLVAGTEISFLVPTGGITAGGVTLAINGGSAKAIKSHLSPAANIAASYLANGIIQLMYNGTSWLDLSQ